MILKFIKSKLKEYLKIIYKITHIYDYIYLKGDKRDPFLNQWSNLITSMINNKFSLNIVYGSKWYEKNSKDWNNELKLSDLNKYEKYYHY